MIKDITSDSKYRQAGISFTNSNYGGFPSKGISDAIGINIFTDWKLPNGTDRVELNKSLCYTRNGLRYDRVMALFTELEELNPCISGWITKTDTKEIERQKFDIVLGVVSMFNENDIKDFITIGGSCDRDKDYHDLKFEVELKINLFMAWVPSVKTLNYIKENYKKL